MGDRNTQQQLPAQDPQAVTEADKEEQLAALDPQPVSDPIKLPRPNRPIQKHFVDQFITLQKTSVQLERVLSGHEPLPEDEQSSELEGRDEVAAFQQETEGEKKEGEAGQGENKEEKKEEQDKEEKPGVVGAVVGEVVDILNPLHEGDHVSDVVEDVKAVDEALGGALSTIVQAPIKALQDRVLKAAPDPAKPLRDARLANAMAIDSLFKSLNHLRDYGNPFLTYINKNPVSLPAAMGMMTTMAGVLALVDGEAFGKYGSDFNLFCQVTNDLNHDFFVEAGYVVPSGSGSLDPNALARQHADGLGMEGEFSSVLGRNQDGSPLIRLPAMAYPVDALESHYEAMRQLNGAEDYLSGKLIEVEKNGGSASARQEQLTEVWNDLLKIPKIIRGRLGQSARQGVGYDTDHAAKLSGVDAHAAFAITAELERREDPGDAVKEALVSVHIAPTLAVVEQEIVQLKQDAKSSKDSIEGLLATREALVEQNAPQAQQDALQAKIEEAEKDLAWTEGLLKPLKELQTGIKRINDLFGGRPLQEVSKEELSQVLEQMSADAPQGKEEGETSYRGLLEALSPYRDLLSALDTLEKKENQDLSGLLEQDEQGEWKTTEKFSQLVTPWRELRSKVQSLLQNERICGAEGDTHSLLREYNSKNEGYPADLIIETTTKFLEKYQHLIPGTGQ